MSSNRARYGIVASPPNFSISPEIPSGPIDLFFSDRCYPLPNDFSISGEEYAGVGALNMLDVTLGAEYRRIIVIKRISLFYRICDEPTMTVFDDRNIFPISFTPFYVLVELRPAFTFFV
jgi:hypothetical protein